MQRSPPPRGHELFPYQSRSPNSDAEQRVFPRTAENKPLYQEPGYFQPGRTGTPPAQKGQSQSPWPSRGTRDNRYDVSDEKMTYPPQELNGRYDSRDGKGSPPVSPDQGYGTIDEQHLLAARLRKDYSNMQDSYMYLGGVDL